MSNCKVLREAIKEAFNYLGYDISKITPSWSEKTQVWGIDPVFWELWIRKIMGRSVYSWQVYYSIWEAVHYIVKNSIGGDLVECGVHKGAGAIVMGEALYRFENKDRKIYCYDTFGGMSEPTSLDYQEGRVMAKQLLEDAPKRNGIPDICYCPYDEALRNVSSSRYPISNYIFVKGKVEETIPRITPLKIALLRLDTDWYESTKHELEHLYPLLSDMGILMIDDYGCWFGARKAVDDYFGSDRPFFVLDAPHGSRIGQKLNKKGRT